MLQKTFEEWYQQGRLAGFGKGYEEGIEKGVEKGIEKGIEEGVRRTALAMFAHGIDPAVISDVTGLSEDELNALLTSAPPMDEAR